MQNTALILDFLKTNFERQKKQVKRNFTVAIIALPILFLASLLTAFLAREASVIIGGFIGVVIIAIYLVTIAKKLHDYKDFDTYPIANIIRNKPEEIVWVYSRTKRSKSTSVKTKTDPNWHYLITYYLVFGLLDGKKYAVEIPEDDFSSVFDLACKLNEKASTGWNKDLQKKFKQNPQDLLNRYEGEDAEEATHPIVYFIAYTVFALFVVFAIAAGVSEFIIKPRNFDKRNNYYLDDKNTKVIELNKTVKGEYFTIKVTGVEDTGENIDGKKKITISLDATPASYLSSEADSYDTSIKKEDFTLIEISTKKRINDNSPSGLDANYNPYAEEDVDTMEFLIPTEGTLTDYYLRYVPDGDTEEIWYFELK